MHRIIDDRMEKYCSYSSSSQSSITAPHGRIFQQTGGESEQQTADCVGIGCCEIFIFVILQNFCNFFYFVYAKFFSNFAKFEIKNFGEILRNYENENFAATLCRSAVRGMVGQYTSTALVHPPRYRRLYCICLLFTKFSILLSIILCLYVGLSPKEVVFFKGLMYTVLQLQYVALQQVCLL